MKPPVLVCPHCGHRIIPNVSARQEKVLGAIKDYVRVNFFAPTLAEIADLTDLSQRVIMYDVEELIRSKRLRRRYRGPRNLFPVEQPRGHA